MTTVYKHVFEITIYNTDPDYDPTRATDVTDDDDGLGRIVEDITQGDSIGVMLKTMVENVPNDRVRTEMIAIGNDGTFFDDVLSEEDESEAKADDDAPKSEI